MLMLSGKNRVNFFSIRSDSSILFMFHRFLKYISPEQLKFVEVKVFDDVRFAGDLEIMRGTIAKVKQLYELMDRALLFCLF